MKNHTEKAHKERLSEKVDKLTDENRRYFLGVVEALNFAQLTSNDTAEKETIARRRRETLENT